jgi:predicted RNase H-like HicB family nuclease
MATHFPIVLELEHSGVFSAYVPGLPVYAQGATKATALTAIRRTLAAYLVAHPDSTTTADVKVATVHIPAVPTRWKPAIAIVGPAALVGRRTSRRKAAASRANGRLGGRPRMRS